tara:strand:+ start:3319 stop:7200 length:3882 start_codon:yes stop_codon:yes gene_type:complete
MKLKTLRQPKASPIPSTQSTESSSSIDSNSSTDSIQSNQSTEQNIKDTDDICKINIQDTFGDLDCSGQKLYDKPCNKFLLTKELIERECNHENRDYLYPTLNDSNFNIKIASKKEFNDTKYDGTIHANVKEYAEKLSKVDFQLQPHQQFVKNFMSSQTPYNSLLLFHGLGTGKTCSAIGVCEEMRDYMKQSGLVKKIIIVASANVQDNFRLQLFDPTKLKSINGIWNVTSCIGNKLVHEVNPTNVTVISKEKLIKLINTMINKYYHFMGYEQFANHIKKTLNLPDGETYSKQKQLDTKLVNRLRNEFDERLIVIDEIHNIRISDDTQSKKVAEYLDLLVTSAMNMRLLFLSATPMYNNYSEIVWLLNIMNINDRRAKIDVKTIFDSNGNFKPNGEELLIRKATGYVSFVRGENPYSFPYRVYPNEFAKKHSFDYIKYPTFQMNFKLIPDESRKRILQLYLSTIKTCAKTCGSCQYCIYKYITNHLRHKENTLVTTKGTREMPSFENMNTFGYTLLQTPLKSLIISYPYENKEDEIKLNIDQGTTVSQLKTGTLSPNELVGLPGLQRMMNFTDSQSPPFKGKFSYKNSTTTKYGAIFKNDKIGKYSSKIKTVLQSIFNPKTSQVSDGLILIYSQYIDAGLIPLALALEEMGFTRYGNQTNTLFENPPTPVVDSRTMKPPSDKSNFKPAKYTLITGDKRLSPDNAFEVAGLTNITNKDGHDIKVVLVSRVGMEGIDFKFIRQVHILDPWYNMNRNEQITGRAVRHFSHKDLEFEKRNVQIFLHGTIIGSKDEEEAADLYVYRFAETKAIQIGRISRLLKETAVDCILNHEQTYFTKDKMEQFMTSAVTQILSTGKIIKNFNIGDAPYSSACDYMPTCDFICRPNKIITPENINQDTYNETYIYMNNDKIMQRIHMLMRTSFFYRKDVLFSLIQEERTYPLIHIYACLSVLIDDETQLITDKYGRSGRLININEYYLFQPLELNDSNVSLFDRQTPVDFKAPKVIFEVDSDQFTNEQVTPTNELIEKLLTLFNLTQNTTLLKSSAKHIDTWYLHAAIVINKFNSNNVMMTEMSGIKEHLSSFVVIHIIEELFFKQKVELLRHLYTLRNIEEYSFQWYAKTYFDTLVILYKGTNYLVMYDVDVLVILLLSTDNLWIHASPLEKKTFIADPSTVISMTRTNYETYVGFIGLTKSHTGLVFKTIEPAKVKSRDTGATCTEAGKPTAIKKLNFILKDKNKYTSKNTQASKNTNTDAISLTELCVTQELYLRYFNLIQKDHKTWFITPEMAMYNKFYKHKD